MDDNKVYSMLIQALRLKDENDIAELLKTKKEFIIEGFDNWNGCSIRLDTMLNIRGFTALLPVVFDCGSTVWTNWL